MVSPVSRNPISRRSPHVCLLTASPGLGSGRCIRGTVAFTLIELLVVIAVVAILAGITLAGLSGVQSKGARDRTAAEVAALANAIERYKSQNDMYPPPNNGLLRLSDIDDYMPVAPSAVSGDNPLDPFGNPYRYRTGNASEQVNIATFDVFSDGPDAGSTNDDIGNW